jgi:ring-1,2-phenylacetyl-CoA epoxidase subunit PaaD
MTETTTDITQHLWQILSEVPDPEVPVLTIADLGVLRNVSVENGKAVVTITPTYSGCPAMDMISMNIRMALLQHGFPHIEIKTVLSPAWTTDWMSEAGKQKLKDYGIAPPVSKSISQQSLENSIVPCPHCGSNQTKLVSEFSSTACKAFYTCNDCYEPFDHFKCH